MKLSLKLLGLILVIGAITGIAAAIRIGQKREQEKSAAAAKGAKQQPALPVAADLGKGSDPQKDAHVLQLFTPADTEFNAVLDEEYPELRSNPGLKDLQSKLVVARNLSDQAIHAFVIKWTLQNSGKAPTVIYTPYVKTPTAKRLATGGVVMAPRESRLLSPWFVLNKTQFANIKSSKAPAEALSAYLQANVPDGERATRVVRSSIDGVIFEDKRFVGPDESKLADRFECERNGQHDEGVSVMRALKAEVSDQELADKLKAHVERGKALQGSTDRESLYQAARGAEAEMFLQVLQQGGRKQLEEVAAKVRSLNRTTLLR